MKDSFYFPHDYNARNDPKLISLAMQGWDLVGLYWAIVEMLHEQGGWMDINPTPIAFALRTHSERIAILINCPGLFKIVDHQFTCSRILSNLKYRKEKSDKARKSAKSLWDKRVTPTADAQRTHSERYARKGKERKGKERQYTAVFDFEILWNKYPKRLGKKDAERHFEASVKTDQDYRDIQRALENYLASEVIHKDGGKYIKHGSTWFNNWRDYIDATATSGKSKELQELENLIHVK